MKSTCAMVVVLLSLLTGGVAEPSESKCKCGTASACLSDMQMVEHVRHVEMDTTKIHTEALVSGVVIFEVTFDKEGRVVGGKAIYGHPMVLPRFKKAMPKWRFTPYVQNGVTRQACGKLRLRFSYSEGMSKVEPEYADSK